MCEGGCNDRGAGGMPIAPPRCGFTQLSSSAVMFPQRDIESFTFRRLHIGDSVALHVARQDCSRSSQAVRPPRKADPGAATWRHFIDGAEAAASARSRQQNRVEME
jgi:hypothetical protein